MLTHFKTEKSFAEAIRRPELATPSFLAASSRQRARSGLNVHRNNVVASLLNVLTARFPVVRALAGDDSFFNAANAFLAAHPPRSPVLMSYGEEFAEFVRQFGNGACLQYIADIAELESARSRAYHAADADPITHDQFASLSAQRIGELRVEFHPSVSLLSSRFPIVSVWQAHQRADRDSITFRAWGVESALIARPYLDVEVRALPRGGYAFLRALADGTTISEAIMIASDAAPHFELPLNLSVMIGANIVTALCY